MSVSAIGGASVTPRTQAPQRAPEAAEVKSAAGDHDGDSDDGGAKAAPAPQPHISRPTATMGNHVNTVA